MSAIGTPQTRHSSFHADAHVDMQVEMRRYALDLRIHALIMLFSGALVSYSGFQIVGVDLIAEAGQPAWIGLQLDVLAIFALTILTAIASFCFFEAYRCWRRAAKAGFGDRHNREAEIVKVGFPPDHPDGGAADGLPAALAAASTPADAPMSCAA